MEIEAKYQGTITKFIRAKEDRVIVCETDPSVRHHYEADEICGQSPTNHHYTFEGENIRGGFYIPVGAELPEFIELHTPKETVEVKLGEREFKLVLLGGRA